MLIQIIILLLAIPIGLFIARLARDELIEGRKWFRIIIIASVGLGGLLLLIGRPVEAITCAFVLIVSFISYMKSTDKKWAKKRFK